MATPVIMPRQGQSVESCIIGKWHVQKGDSVNEGDILFTYETDKATFEEEAKISGTIIDIYFQEGDDVPCLTNVCVIGSDGEDTSGFNPHNTAKEKEIQTEQINNIEPSLNIEPPVRIDLNVNAPALGDASIKISPRAKKLAEKSSIDYRYATPTGPNKRVIERDIVALLDRGMVFTPSAREMHMHENTFPVTGTGIGGRITTQDLLQAKTIQDSPASKFDTLNVQDIPFEDIKLPHIRKVIAKSMHSSLSESAQLTLNTSFDASAILDYRSMIKSSKDNMGIENITINDMIIFAVSRTLVKHRDLNAHYMGETMRYFRNVNLGVAVDTERGLMVPTIMDANMKSLNEISAEIKLLAKECQSGTINPDKLKNGTFTVTNLGTFGIESFTPVLNPPQTGILGVNTITQKVRELDGKLCLYPSMTLSLTFDHRALDGAPAARFLKELKTNLENFTVLLAR